MCKRQQQDKQSNNIPNISDYILDIKNLDSIIKKPSKSNLSNIATNIIFNNENIYSFNKKNIDVWSKLYYSTIKTNKSSVNDIKNGSKIPDNLMKFIISHRKKLLLDILKKCLDELKGTILDTKKYNEFIKNIEFIVQNLLKFEFLGLCIINIKTYNYPLFCYYFGDDNTIENLSKKSNWKILPNSIIDLFHGTYKKSWKEHLSLTEDYYNANNMEQNYTFEIISSMKENQLKLLYPNQFLIPKIIDNNQDKDQLKLLKFDLRYFSRKYQKLLNTLTPKPIKKRKREEKEENEEGKEEVVLKSEDNNNNNNEQLTKKQKLNHYAYGFNNGLVLSNENYPTTIEDWKNKNNIIPTNIDNITMVDFKEIVANKISQHQSITINSGLLPDTIISAFNPIGIVKNSIRYIGLKKSITVKNDNNQLSNLEEKLLDDESNHEDIRRNLYSHLNSIVILSILSRGDK
jgi:hypothetical protein